MQSADTHNQAADLTSFPYTFDNQRAELQHFLEQAVDSPPLPLINCGIKPIQCFVRASLNPDLQGRAFSQGSILLSHLPTAGEESSLLRARGSCLIAWQGSTQTLFSVCAGFQSLRLCFEFCIQNKSKTSERPQTTGAD